jgi:hypothetical protein
LGEHDFFTGKCQTINNSFRPGEEGSRQLLTPVEPQCQPPAGHNIRGLYEFSNLFSEYFEKVLSNPPYIWSENKLFLNLRSLIFAFEENKTILKFNSPPGLQCPSVSQK